MKTSILKGIHPSHTPGSVTAVVGMPRCASTLVMDVLRQHPGIISADELFAYGEKERDFFHRQAFGEEDGDHVPETAMKEPRAVHAYLDACQGKAFLASRAFAFKLLDHQNPNAWAWALQKANLFVYIVRDNPLEALVSEMYGHKVQSWHARSAEQAAAFRGAQALIGPIEVKPWEFLKWMRRKEMLESLLAGRGDVVRVNYTYLTKMTAEAISEIVATIGIENGIDARVAQVKIATAPIWARVSNYAQLKREFHGTEYAYCFPFPLGPEPGQTIAD